MCGWLASFPRQRRDPSFWITPPLHVDAKWTAFWDTAHLPSTPLPPSPAYTRSSGPTSAWALHPALPDAPLVTSSACPDCGRPTPHTAFVDLPASPTDHWPHFFCTSPHKAPPVCTRDTAARCVVGFQGMLPPGAVPVSAIPWATPCAPPPDRLLQPTPAFVLSLPDPRDQASTPLRDTALTFLGLHALAGHSTNAEWIAKIAAMFALRGWSGEALFASDSTASQLCDLTRGPPPSSALSIPYRAALLSASFRMHEAWLPAQHDSGSASHLATLNAEADSLARRGLHAASPWTLPWSALFHGRIVALREGAIFLSPARAAEAAYAATTARTHALHLRPLPPGWSSHLLRLAYERAEIPALALHRIMHLRLLHSQDHPPGYGGVTCPFCHRPYPDSAAHLQYHCPPHYALQLLLAWRLFTHPPILAATAGHSPRLVTPLELRTATTAVYLSEHLPAAPRPGPPTQLGFNLLGMWHSTSPHGAPPLLDSAGREGLLRELLSTLSTTHTSLASLLRRAPSHVTAPPPPLPPHVPTPPCTQPHTLRHNIALVWLLRHCATWRLTVDRRPVVPLPPGPLPGPHPAHVVFTPTSRAADILPLLAAIPPGQRILLAANPSVLSEVLIRHADALHVRPLLPDLHVAYAPGTPVDPSVWDSQ